MTRAFGAALILLHASFASAQVHEGRTIVKARLIADTVRVQPGAAFTAAVHLTIAPGWHVYWENPGDTALPIQVTWEVPAEATVSPLRWPEPRKYQEQGGVTVFGYESETLLLSTIAPSPVQAGQSFTLKAKADWLVCEKVCLPGEAALSLTLEAGDPAPSDDAATIRRFAAMVPVDGAVAGIRIGRAVARKHNDRWLLALNVDVPRGRLNAFFPRRIDGFAIEHGTIAVKGNAVEFAALPDEPNLQPGRLSGVAVTDRGSFDVSAAVSVEVPPSAAASEPPQVNSAPPADARATGSSSGSVEVAVPDPRAGDWLDRDFTTTVASRQLPLLTLLAFAALGGLLLNVMPCVLPIISLKILGFVHQAGHHARHTRVLGLMFAGGVVVSFWILVGAVAAIRATGEQIGWGFQFQSPGFVLAMTVVVLGFAMNLFGAFEISGPALSGTGGQGPAGAFFHGTLATVLATPCTAPFLGTAIGFAFTQPLSVLFLAFTAAAFGLALPYVLLSWNPQWLRWLPRPGAWMIRFKQAMGFVLLATLVWLLSILGAQLGPEGVVWTLAFLTIVTFAVWMVGVVPERAGRARRLASMATALALVAAGYVWTLEIELRWRAPVGDAATAAEAGGDLGWEPFSLADLRARVERGETVFIDFTAGWCWSCKVNERAVLSTSEVQTRLRELNVTPVKADWTTRNPEITRLLAKFGRAGVPFYAVFPAGRLTEPIGLSEVITSASVIDALERAGPSRVTVQQ